MPHNSQSTPAKRKGIFKKFYALANVASGLDFFMLVRIPFVDNNETRNRQKTWKGKMKYEGYIFYESEVFFYGNTFFFFFSLKIYKYTCPGYAPVQLPLTTGLVHGRERGHCVGTLEK